MFLYSVLLVCGISHRLIYDIDSPLYFYGKSYYGVWSSQCIAEFTFYFTEDFYICIHQGYWPIFFLGGVESLYEFVIRVILVEGIWGRFFVFTFLGYFQKDMY